MKNKFILLGLLVAFSSYGQTDQKIQDKDTDPQAGFKANVRSKITSLCSGLEKKKEKLAKENNVDQSKVKALKIPVYIVGAASLSPIWSKTECVDYYQNGTGTLKNCITKSKTKNTGFAKKRADMIIAELNASSCKGSFQVIGQPKIQVSPSAYSSKHEKYFSKSVVKGHSDLEGQIQSSGFGRYQYGEILIDLKKYNESQAAVYTGGSNSSTTGTGAGNQQASTGNVPSGLTSTNEICVKYRTEMNGVYAKYGYTYIGKGKYVDNKSGDIILYNDLPAGVKTNFKTDKGKITSSWDAQYKATVGKSLRSACFSKGSAAQTEANKNYSPTM